MRWGIIEKGRAVEGVEVIHAIKEACRVYVEWQRKNRSTTKLLIQRLHADRNMG